MNPEIISIAANTIDLFFRGLAFLIIIRILVSWLAPAAGGRVMEFLFSVTEPVLAIFRKLPLRAGMIDFSPIVALLALNFTRMILLKILFAVAI